MRFIAFILSSFVLTVALALAHLDPPDGPPMGRTNVTLAGTEWIEPPAGRTGGAAYRLWFHPDGTLEYESDTGRYRNGTWQQVGNTLTYETNQRYAVATAVIDGDIIRGSTSNKAGDKWDWVVHRK